jgi:hypothetical protein
MGLFDLFKGKSKDSAPPAAGGDKNVARFARAAGDKHAQNYDRMEALEALARIPTSESAAAMLRRFTFHIDPSITDQEEKEVAFRGILACGEESIGPIRAFCRKADSLSWPLKVLKELLPPERYGEELVKLLEPFDTEYVRNVEPKVQLLSELEHTKSPAAREAAEKFLEDVNESIRFVAVNATFAQDDPASVEPLVRVLLAEESMRVKNKISEGLASRGWAVPEALRDETAKSLPREYVLKGDGTVARR